MNYAHMEEGKVLPLRELVGDGKERAHFSSRTMDT